MLDARTARRCEDGENLGEGERGGHRGPQAGGDGRAYTQERASEWVPFFMMDMWMPVLLHLWLYGLL